MKSGPALLISCGLIAAPALAQPAPTEPATPGAQPPAAQAPAAQASPTDDASNEDAKFWQREDRWTARFEPSAWFAGASGNVKLPRSSETAGGNPRTFLRELNQDSGSRLSPFGEINLRKGIWGFTARGFVYGSDRTANGTSGRVGDLPISNGDDLSSSYDFTNLDLEVRYTIAPSADKRVYPGKARARPRLDLVAGVRAFDIKWSVTNNSLPSGTDDPPNSASADEFFLTPVIGAKGSIEVYDRFTIDLQLVVGALPFGDQDCSIGDVIVGGTWKPYDHVGVQVGYRALFYNLTSGNRDAEFENTGTLQGLYAGVVIEF